MCLCVRSFQWTWLPHQLPLPLSESLWRAGQPTCNLGLWNSVTSRCICLEITGATVCRYLCTLYCWHECDSESLVDWSFVEKYYHASSRRKITILSRPAKQKSHQYAFSLTITNRKQQLRQQNVTAAFKWRASVNLERKLKSSHWRRPIMSVRMWRSVVMTTVGLNWS